MSHIIIMDSKEFLKKFVKKYNHNNFNFLLISEDIKTTGDYETTYALKALLPPAYIISEFINNGFSDDYKKKYLEYLSMPKVESLLTVIVKLAVIDKSDVILLCSEHEMQYKFMKLISYYLESIYKVNTCTFKEFDKDSGSCEAINKKKKKIMSILKKKLSNINLESIQESTINIKSLKKRLKQLSKNDLREICNDGGIKFKKSDEKEDLVKKILKNKMG